MEHQRFSDLLRELRQNRQWTISTAAKNIGISRFRLDELERGVSRSTNKATRPSREVIDGIAEAYGFPKDHLLELAGFARENRELSDRESLIVELFRSLPSEHQEMALRILQAMKEPPASSNG